MASPDVDGAYILGPGWNEIEPEPGRMDWSFFDSQLAAVAAAHKKASIGFLAGRYTPEWVYREGAKPFDTVVEIPRRESFCDPVRLPIPWDPPYLRALTRLIGAMGRRYAGDPVLSLVKVVGIGYRTDETSLPFEQRRTVLSKYNGKSCTYPDDLQQWQADGYTPGKVTQALRTILGAYADAFPGLPLAMMVGGLPPIGDDGKADRGINPFKTFDAMNARLLEVGRELLGARFIGQANSLKATGVDRAVADFGRTGAVGYQAAWHITADPWCMMTAGRPPCEPAAVMQATLDQALKGHARYIELFSADVLNPALQDALRRADEELYQRSR